jgi:hypothetical protein
MNQHNNPYSRACQLIGAAISELEQVGDPRAHDTCMELLGAYDRSSKLALASNTCGYQELEPVGQIILRLCRQNRGEKALNAHGKSRRSAIQ